jgi:N-acetylneuraminate lyase
MKDFRGILPAVVTPFDAQGRFQPSAFAKLLDHVYNAGVHGVYVNGQTGEGALQSPAQRKQVAALAVESSPRDKLVVIHVGAHTASDVIELAKHASHVGADAISSLPPIGNHSFAEIKSYYENLADASDVPLLIYYCSDIACNIETIDQFLSLCDIPNVIGLKFTDHNLFRLSRIKRHGAVMFNGSDEVLVAGLLMGADGGIGSFYNIVPELFVEVYECALAQQWQRAHDVQMSINELVDIGLHFPVYPAIKLMLSWKGIDCGRCHPSHRSLTPAEETRLRTMLVNSSRLEERFATLIT